MATDRQELLLTVPAEMTVQCPGLAIDIGTHNTNYHNNNNNYHQNFFHYRERRCCDIAFFVRCSIYHSHSTS